MAWTESYRTSRLLDLFLSLETITSLDTERFKPLDVSFLLHVKYAISYRIVYIIRSRH